MTRNDRHRARGSKRLSAARIGPVRRPIPHPGVELAFENTDLVPEHHDLDVLVRLGSTARHDEAEEPAQAEVEEGEGHGG